MTGKALCLSLSTNRWLEVGNNVLSDWLAISAY
jgi:hypothetical protein